MANRVRGEMEIQLGTVTLTLVPDFEGLQALEEAIGGGLFVAWEKLNQGSVIAMSQIIWACASAGGTRAVSLGGKPVKITVADVYGLVVENGITDLTGDVGTFLSSPLQGLSNLSEESETDAQEADEPEEATKSSGAPALE